MPSILIRPGLVAALCAAFLSAGPASGQSTADQLVIVSFDGAHDNALWEKSRIMAGRTGAHFTYFLSCVFLMTKDDARSYRAPGEPAGGSNVGFAPDRADVAARLRHIWQARAEGHEIASHGCGHFDGAAWSADDWSAEFAAFDGALAEAWARNGLGEREPDGWRRFVESEVDGFRAPYLSVSNRLDEALAGAGYRYDASRVSDGPVAAERTADLLRFSLPMVPEGPGRRPVIAMDYNFFARHSDAVETADGDGAFEDRAYRALKAAFDRQYDTTRVPLQIGFHFVEMNGGAYWRALDRLLSETCGMTDVACVSYAEAIRRGAAPDAPF